MNEHKKVYSLILFVLFIILVSPVKAMAYNEAEPDVEIRLDGSTGQSLTSNQQIAVQLDIIFHNKALYNDKLYLSYHIYDKSGNILLYEGQRYLIQNGENGEIIAFPVGLNLADYAETKEEKDVTVEFDIVDEKNSFWFSSSPDIAMKSATVVYNGHFGARLKTVAVNVIHQPLALFVNILVSFLFIVGILFYINTQNRELKKGPFYQEGDLRLDRLLYERYFTASQYDGSGCIICAGRTEPIKPYLKFFIDSLEWKLVDIDLQNCSKHKVRKVQLLCIGATVDVLQVLIQMNKQCISPKVICFDFNNKDYDKIMKWAQKKSYRYDFHQGNYVFLKRKNVIEKILY